MKIPKTFSVAGQDIEVDVSTEVFGEDGAYGCFINHSNKIKIAAGLNEDMKGHTFCHELTHSILEAMCHELNDDEAFVDQFGGYLYQVLKTMKGEAKEPEKSE